MTTNLFKKAVQEQQLLEFALGLNAYFIPDREYGGHWVLESWRQNIIPLLNANEPAIENQVVELFTVLIETKSITEEEKTNALLHHLHVFYYELKENKFSCADILTSLKDKIMEQVELTRTKNALNSREEENKKLDFSLELIRKNGGLK